MTNALQQLDGNLYDWLQEIKPYQRESIQTLLNLNNNNPEIVAEIYLSADGATNTIKFGGVAGQNATFFNNFKKEVKQFVCGDPKYNYYYEEIKKIVQPTKSKATIAMIICGAISPVLGISVAVIYPVIILLLASIFTIGINAYCGL